MSKYPVSTVVLVKLVSNFDYQVEKWSWWQKIATSLTSPIVETGFLLIFGNLLRPL